MAIKTFGDSTKN